MSSSLWLPIAAFAVSLGVVRLVERYARVVGLVDVPNVRSSHVAARPRGGGIGIVLGVVLPLTAAAFVHPIPRTMWALISAPSFVAAVGLWDDIRRIGPWPRLLAQAVAAVWIVIGVGAIDRLPLPPPLDVPLGVLGPALTLVWLVGVTNFFNFMDGLDGLAGGQAIVTLSALAWAMWPEEAAGLALVTAAASAAFLLRNWSPARVFLGDVGSSFLGLMLATLPLAGSADVRPRLTLLVAVSLALFLLDPVATLFARARRGAALGVAHREHAYQQFVAPGASHATVVARLLVTAAALSLVAVAGYQQPSLAWLGVIAATIAFGVEWWLAARRRRADSAP